MQARGLNFAFWHHVAIGASDEIFPSQTTKNVIMQPRQESVRLHSTVGAQKQGAKNDTQPFQSDPLSHRLNNDDVGGMRLIPITHIPAAIGKKPAQPFLGSTTVNNQVRLRAQECAPQLDSRCGGMDLPTEKSDNSTVDR